MNRFQWGDSELSEDECLVTQQNGVRIYDGDQKTTFDHGKLLLTGFKLIWKDHKKQNCVLVLPLSSIVLVEQESATFTKSPKIVVHLSAAAPDKPAGPVAYSSNNYVKFSFKEGGHREFVEFLTEEMKTRRWEKPKQQTTQRRHFRSGITGIERTLEQRHKETDENISQAFQDLSKLMVKAKEMVILTKSISDKIKEKQGDISDDETVQFKSYLLSLGISDPVTRETHGTGDKYFRELAKQISSVMEEPLKKSGGIMTLSDVYCRLNRARGMELLSPNDLIDACRLMDSLKLPVMLQTFESGVKVLQLRSHNESYVIQETEKLVKDSGSLTADELAKVVNLSVILSKERLLMTERSGKICRDESTEGLRFYPNLFMTSPE